MAKSDDRRFIQYPRFEASLPEDGKVTGTLKFAVTRGHNIHISTDTAVNTNTPGVQFRDRDYSVSIHATLLNGVWTSGEYTKVVRSDTFDVSAPRTHYAAVVDAVMALIPSVVTGAMLANAEYADKYNDETYEMGKVEKLEQALREARAILQRATHGRRLAEEAREASMMALIAEKG